MSVSGIVGAVTSKALELVALYAELDALRQNFKDNPPKTAPEIAARLNEIALLADRIAKLASSFGNSTADLSDAEVATIIAESHARNQQAWPDTQPTPAAKFPYNTELLMSPLAMDEGKLLVSGDRIYRNTGLGRAWLVKSKDDPTRDTPPAEGWELTSQQPT